MFPYFSSFSSAMSDSKKDSRRRKGSHGSHSSSSRHSSSDKRAREEFSRSKSSSSSPRGIGDKRELVSAPLPPGHERGDGALADGRSTEDPESSGQKELLLEGQKSPRLPREPNGDKSPVRTPEWPGDLGELRDLLGVNVIQQDQNALRVAFGLMSEEFKGVKEILGSIAASVGAKRHLGAPSELESEVTPSKRSRFDSGDESTCSAASDMSFVPFDREPAAPEKVWTARQSVVRFAADYFDLKKERKTESLTHWQNKYLLPSNAPKELSVPELDSAAKEMIKSIDFYKGKSALQVDRNLASVHTKLLHVVAPVLNLWQMLKECNGEISEPDRDIMQDCAATAVWLLGSAHSKIADVRRSSLAEVSYQPTAKDLFGLIPDDPTQSLRNDLGSKARELASGKKALVDTLKPKQSSQRGRGASSASTSRGRGGFRGNRKFRPPPSRQSGGNSNSKFYWGSQYSRTSNQSGDGKKSK